MIPTRSLGKTDIALPILSFGASSLGAEFRSITMEEAMLSTKTALDLGMNFIDTSPFYGRGMSEIMLGLGLKGIPRDSYILGSKLGRYSDVHFDFSAKRVENPPTFRSSDSKPTTSTSYSSTMSNSSPWSRSGTKPSPPSSSSRNREKSAPSAFPVIRSKPSTPSSTMSKTRSTASSATTATPSRTPPSPPKILPRLQAKGIGAMNAGPFSARLLTNAELPEWLKEPEEVKQAARDAAKLCSENGVDIAQLALQFSCEHPDIATTVAGSANPKNIAKWAEWLAAPIDRELMEKVQAIFEPVKDLGHKEGLPENN